jgi:hypothetical protein
MTEETIAEIPDDEREKCQWIIYLKRGRHTGEEGYFIDAYDCMTTSHAKLATTMTFDNVLLQANILLENGFMSVAIFAVVNGEAIPSYNMLHPLQAFHLLFYPPYNVGDPIREAYWCGAVNMWHTYLLKDAKRMTEKEAKSIQQDIKAKYNVVSRVVREDGE